MSVGYKLYREIRDMAPADWSSGELVVALMIADDARDESRRSWIPLELLCYRTRLRPSTVREALAKLAARGYEFRVCHGYGKDGRPVFATKGHAVDYEVPDMVKGAGLPAAMPGSEPVDNSAKGAGVPAAMTPAKALESPPKALENHPKGAGIPAPLSLSPLSKKNSTEETDVADSNVEGAATCGQPKPDFAASNGHHMTRIELDAWLATHHAPQ
jgi:hypothetical protein